MSSPISTILANLRRTVNILRSAVYAIDVRDDIADAIDDSADAIEQIYSDVDSASLREDAFAAALQEAIDDNLLPIPATVIDDNSLPGTKIQDGTIPLRKLSEAVQITVDSALSGTSTNPVQNKVIKETIDELNGSLHPLNTGNSIYVTWTTGAYIRTDGATVNVNSPVTNVNQKYCVIDVEEGDRYYLYTSNGELTRGYCFIDIDTNVLAVAASSETLHDVVVTAPENAVKLILNGKNNDTNYAYKINPILEELKEHEDEITLLQKNPIFDISETYNLVDYENDVMWNTGITVSTGFIHSSVGSHFCYKYIPVEVGDVIKATKRMYSVIVYDNSKAVVGEIINRGNDQFWFAKITQDNAAYMRIVMNAYGGSHKDSDLAENEPFSVYKVTTTTLGSDRKPAIPKKQIDGRYVTKSIYEVSIPDVNTDFMRYLQMRMIKKENAERGVLRIGSFNIFGAMINPQGNWWVVKKEVMDYGLNICGFQEVSNGMLEDDGVTQRFSFKEVMTGEQLPYSDLSVGSELNAAQRILADCEITTGEYVPYTLTFYNTTKTFGYAHCIMNLPNYHHARAWNKQLSMYACHFSTTGAEARAMIAHMLEVLEADTTEYKVLAADTNCFRLGEDGRPWCWALLEAGGLYPSLTDFTKSSYTDPITQEKYDSGELDMIDNVFISSNMKCINWNIVDSKNYLIPGVSGGAVSDHCMVYADVIFDYVDGFEDA